MEDTDYASMTAEEIRQALSQPQDMYNKIDYEYLPANREQRRDEKFGRGKWKRVSYRKSSKKKAG